MKSITRFQPTRHTKVQRRLGWLMSVGGVVLIVGQLARVESTNPPYALWWKALSLTVIVLVVVNALFGLILPMRVLRIGWVLTPTLGFITQLLTFQGYQGGAPDTIFPWEWTLSAVFVSYPVLLVTPKLAIGIALIAGFLPAASGFLALGRIPEATALQTPIQISNFAFTVIFIGIQSRLQHLRSSELQAKDQEERRVRARIEAARHEDFARLVHDEVLATLSAAQRFSSAIPDLLKTQARQALLVLEDFPLSVEKAVEIDRVVIQAQDIAAEIDKDCHLTVTAHSGIVPGAVAAAMLSAMSEALRNSARHAGADAKREITVQADANEIQIEIRDNGIGFNLDTIGVDRLGIRESIVGRMGNLAGGSAEITTQVGQGTRVALEWHA